MWFADWCLSCTGGSQVFLLASTCQHPLSGLRVVSQQRFPVDCVDFMGAKGGVESGYANEHRGIELDHS